MNVDCEAVEAGSGEVATREGNMSLWQVQVLSRGRNTPDSRLTHSPTLQCTFLPCISYF